MVSHSLHFARILHVCTLKEGIAGMPSISIVVPFYQSGGTIDGCISSIVGQSFDDWELILVDDGSMDGGPALAESWAERDGRISVMHQPNAGRSAARNAGMGAATGDWVAFCEADDRLLPGVLDALMDLTGPNTDVVSGSYESQNRHAEEPYVSSAIDPALILDSIVKSAQDPLPGQLATFFSSNSSRSAWAKLYKREIAVCCSFPEGMRVGEDAFFNIQVLALAKTVACTSRPVYFYDIGGEGTVRSYSPGSGRLLAEYCRVARETFVRLRGIGICDEADELQYVGTEYRREWWRAVRYADDLAAAAGDFSHMGADTYAQSALLEHARRKNVLKRAFITFGVMMAKRGKLEAAFKAERLFMRIRDKRG